MISALIVRQNQSGTRAYRRTANGAVMRHMPGHILMLSPLSLRYIEDLLHERGIEISHEAVRFW